MEALTMISTIGTICGILNNLTPILAVIENNKNYDISKIPHKYLKVNHLAQLCWFFYGIKKHTIDFLMIDTVNVVLSGISLFLYHKYSKQMNILNTLYMTGLIWVLAICVLVLTNKFLEMVCRFLTIATFMLLSESFQMALRTGNYRYIDLKINGSACLYCLAWIWYGITAGDFKMVVTNGFCMFFALGMIVAHFYYRSLKIVN